jgi:hypothetical protein
MTARPRWTIRRATQGKWGVACSINGERPRFRTWPRALDFVNRQISRWAVSDVLARAAEVPGEYEGVPAMLIDAPTLARACLKIREVGAYRHLSVSVAVEEEDDPRDTTIYVSVRPK